MTKRPALTSRSLTSIVDDPTQPEFLRELVQAGRQSDLSNADLGYDFEEGFKKHLALIASGAPMPPWAQGLPVKGAPSAPSVPAGTGAAAAGSSVLAGWLAGAAVGVAVVSAAWLLSHPASPAPKAGQVVGAPIAPMAPMAPETSPVSPVLPAPADGSATTPTDGTGKAAATQAAPDRGAKVQHGGRPEAVETPRANGRNTHADRATDMTGPSVTGSSVTRSAPPASIAPNAAPTAPGAASVTGSSRSGSQQVAAERPEAQPVAAADAKPLPQEDGKLEREMAMLSMAQRVLPSDPKRALSLARQGEAEFSGSMFTQERQQLLLLALVKLGELDEARRLAKPFLQRYPTGPFSERVRHALASGSVQR